MVGEFFEVVRAEDVDVVVEDVEDVDTESTVCFIFLSAGAPHCGASSASRVVDISNLNLLYPGYQVIQVIQIYKLETIRT